MKPRSSLLLVFILFSTLSYSQTPAKWNVNGNVVINGDFFGTLNNEPLIFKANGSEVMRLKPNGELRLSGLSGFGNGIVTVNNNGVIGTTPFTGDTTKVLTGAGTFRSIYSISGWKRVGNNVVNNNGAFVGIGTNNPQYILDVNGTVRFNGIVNATGINIVNLMEADTVKGSSIMVVNNNLALSSDGSNEIFTYNGDVTIQSRSGYNGNTVFSAGTSGNVGIGIYAPLYKLDVDGGMRVNGTIRTARVTALPGDTLIAFGDSTIYISTTSNKITHSTTSVTYKGMSIGAASSSGHGLNSVAIGTGVWTTATAINSIVVGSGATQALRNDIPNCLMVGFNSNIPTLFVGTAGGIGTFGKVGIGTTNPQYTLHVNGTLNAAQIFENGVPVTSPWTRNANGDILFDVSAGGSVGIGVAGNVNSFLCGTAVCPTGKYLLAVGGGIRAKSLKVEPLWSDYVFDSAYVLLPLDSVAGYIALYHHLPNVPSAEEVKVNGIDVGESQAMLLAKIEELTLYLLQLQQQNAVMQKEIEDLKKR